MRIQNVEQSHNQVSWQVNTQLLPMLVGMLVALVVSVTLLTLLPNPNTLRGVLLAGLILSTLAAALYLALTTPLSEKGLIERTPEGGSVDRTQRFLLQGTKTLLSIPLAEVTAFGVEERTFEQTGGELVTLARLWIHLTREGESVMEYLTGWLAPEAIQELAASSAKAARKPLLDGLTAND